MEDLDDQTKSCVYIAPDDDREQDHLSSRPYSPHQWRDLPDGYDLRLRAYREVWMEVLDRMQLIIQTLHAAVVRRVIEEVHTSYKDILPGLPYPELPVVAISSPGGGLSLYTNIIQQLQENEDIEDDDVSEESPETLLIHIYPVDCSNLMSMMKAIVTGFIEQTDSGNTPKNRRPAAALANYDINMLEAWYSALESTPSLVVFLHDFEQFDPAVIQDALYICSLHIPRLPFVFILALSSPPTPSYIHATYPRSTLALLRIRTFRAPFGYDVVEEIMHKTFFDPNFNPAVMLGPSVLDFIRDFAARHTSSLDALLTIVQLAYMKHFTEPLTVLARSSLLRTGDPTLASQKLEDPASRVFVHALHSRLLPSSDEHSSITPDSQILTLLDAVDSARSAFHQKARQIRTGMAAARIVRRVALGHPGEPRRGEEATELAFASAALRGRVTREVRYLTMAVKKLSEEKLRALLHELHDFLQQLDNPVLRAEEQEALTRIESVMVQLPLRDLDGEAAADEIDPDMGSSRRDPVVVQLAEAVGGWLAEYLEERLDVRFDEGTLWDVWYTGSTPFPSELINPAPRATIVSALAYPHDFVSAHARLLRASEQSQAALPEPDQDGAEDVEMPDSHARAIWELPDTSILFRRSVDAGRMINVYDWFQAFAVVLDEQRRRLRMTERRGHEDGAQTDGSPGEANENGYRYAGRSERGKGKMRHEVGEEDDEHADGDGGMEGEGESEGHDEMGEMDVEESEEQAEEWRLEVQARFVRALHELDFLGFVKPTGRKADHVVRTTFDVVD